MSKPKFHEVRGVVFCVECGSRATQIPLFTSLDYYCKQCEDASDEPTDPGSSSDWWVDWKFEDGQRFFIKDPFKAPDGFIQPTGSYYYKGVGDTHTFVRDLHNKHDADFALLDLYSRYWKHLTPA